MKRREFLTLAGSAAASPFAARAQQGATSAIGFLASFSSSYLARVIPPFSRGLGETGYVDGRNATIEYRMADGQYERLAGLAGELLARKVAVIVAIGGSEPAKVAKAATSTVPIVFVSAADPIRAGVVTSFNRPEGNITGVSLLGSELEAKRLELLHQMVPGVSPLGVLLNPKYPDFDLELQELQDGAKRIKREIIVARASTVAEIDDAFSMLTQKAAGGLSVTQDPFFSSQREHLISLVAKYKLPAIYNQREYAEIGGLFSYGADFSEGFRQAGVYAGKLLKGARISDLPILQPVKYELVINLATAKKLGLAVPASLQALSDEVIE